MYCPQSTEAAATARFLIVQTGTTLAPLRARHGDFPHWFQRRLGVQRDDVDVIRVDLGQALPLSAGYAGVIVTGSPAMVSQRDAWSEATAAWLREAIDADAAILGVCYGHQLLAHALGGHVDYHPQGREVGTVAIEKTATADEDALLTGVPANFLAHASHRQSVLQLPPGAVALARSAHDAHHAVRYAPNVWGLQFHPEFSVEIMRGYLRGSAPSTDGHCAEPCCARQICSPAPQAGRLLRRFRAIAEAHRARLHRN